MDAASGGSGGAEGGGAEGGGHGAPHEVVARAVDSFNAGAVDPAGVARTGAALGAFILGARYRGVDRGAVAAQCNARPQLCAAIADALPLSGVDLPLALEHLASVVDLGAVLSEAALDCLLRRFVEAYFEKNGAGEEGGGSPSTLRARSARSASHGDAVLPPRPPSTPPTRRATSGCPRI